MRGLEREADRVLRGILKNLPDLRVESNWENSAPDLGYDLTVYAAVKKARFRFCVQVKSRVTPQTALSATDQLRGVPKGTIPMIFSPTVSPRVAQILRAQGIGYADGAGNCWLRSLQGHLLIERQGFQAERKPTPAAADPFSPKSSRIVRALLSRPLEGWQVRKLADDANVQVSPGLVVKVKRALIEEGYAMERERLLFLRDPLSLLTAWSEKYAGPAEQVALYFRGDARQAEEAIGHWCRDNELQYALAGFSAAWRLAPEVRYSVGAAYVENRGFEQQLLDQLTAEYGAKRVGTGPNLQLWRTVDHAVFAGKVDAGPAKQVVTSPLQTYLDLKRMAGRGEDAANAVFDKYLRHDLEAPAKLAEELQRGTV